MSNESTVHNSPSAVPDDVVATLDAILVLGGGVPFSVDEPPVYVQRRCDDAAAVRERHLLRSEATGGPSPPSLPILCLSAGTAHLPQLLCGRGLPIWESTASAAYLKSKKGVDDRDLFVETTSYDTIGNAYFARTCHIEVNGWRKLLVVTNEFHMARSKAIFDWIFSLEAVDAAPSGYELHYLSSPNVGLSEEALAARAARESASLQNVVESLAPQLSTLRQVWRFLHTEHDLYASEGLVRRGRAARADEGSVDASVKKSYGGAPSQSGSGRGGSL